MTTPGTPEEQSLEDYVDPLDDVFGSAPPSPSPSTSSALHVSEDQARSVDAAAAPQKRSILDPSDIPRLRSTHVTNGYREGIAASKERHIQEGFDEGYALGAELGMRVGWCLGILEGLGLAARGSGGPSSFSFSSSEEGARDHGSEKGKEIETIVGREDVKKLLAEAEEALRVQRLFGREYFGEDGVWTYEVPDQAEEVTFKDVADAHPLLKKWMEIALHLAESGGVDVQ